MFEVFSSIVGAILGGIIGGGTLAVTSLFKKSHEDVRALAELSSGLNHIAIELERFREDMRSMIAEQRDYIKSSREEVLLSQNDLGKRVSLLERDSAVLKASILTKT